MKARTVHSTHSELHLASMEPLHYPYAEYTAEIQDLFSHAMDRALGMQKASFDAVVKMQSDVIEMQKHVCAGEPVYNDLAELSSEAFNTCMEIQMTWLKLLVNCAQKGTEIWMHLAGMGVMLAASPELARMPVEAVQKIAVAKVG